MHALRALALLCLLAPSAAAAGPRLVAGVDLPAAPLATVTGAAAPALPSLPAAAGDSRPVAEMSLPVSLPSAAALPQLPAAQASPEAAKAPSAAPSLAQGSEAGPTRASAALAAISDLIAKAPEPSASLEDAAGRARSVAGLMTSETVRGPPQASADAGPESGVVRVKDVKAALAALRAASFERHEDTDALVARLAAEHPELPLSADDVFLVKDAAALGAYGIPDAAAGAARIVSDGREERHVVILAAPRGVSLDDFVEYSIHEAVHLRDDGILRVPHERFVEHWLAEGWTQLRSHAMANESLKSLGRPERPNAAYSGEVALVRAFIARYGDAPLRELVERGSDAGLRRALGERWTGLLALAAEEPGEAVRQRAWFLQLMQVVVEHPEFGPLDFRSAARALNGERPS